MIDVLRIDAWLSPSTGLAVDRAEAALAAGELVVFPTDTVYGIACRPDEPAAIARVFDAKHRPADLPLPVLAATAEAAFELAVRTPQAVALAEAFWPGALTLVLPRSARSAGWSLGGSGDTIALRVPAEEVTLALLRRTGPLAVTSANRSGHPPASSPDELAAAFGDQVAVYLVRGTASPTSEGPPSTLVDVTVGPPHVLRQGAIPATAVRAALGGSWPPVESVD